MYQLEICYVCCRCACTQINAVSTLDNNKFKETTIPIVSYGYENAVGNDAIASFSVDHCFSKIKN